MGAAIVRALIRMRIIIGCLSFCIITSLIVDKIRKRRD